MAALNPNTKLLILNPMYAEEALIYTNIMYFVNLKVAICFNFFWINNFEKKDVPSPPKLVPRNNYVIMGYLDRPEKHLIFIAQSKGTKRDSDFHC